MVSGTRCMDVCGGAPHVPTWPLTSGPWGTKALVGAPKVCFCLSIHGGGTAMKKYSERDIILTAVPEQAPPPFRITNPTTTSMGSVDPVGGGDPSPEILGSDCLHHNAVVSPKDCMSVGLPPTACRWRSHRHRNVPQCLQIWGPGEWEW